MQVLGVNPKSEGIGNVSAVKKGGEVYEEEDEYYAYIYLSEQVLLVNERRTFEGLRGILCAADWNLANKSYLVCDLVPLQLLASLRKDLASLAHLRELTDGHPIYA